jgi:hypothetical protein
MFSIIHYTDTNNLGYYDVSSSQIINSPHVITIPLQDSTGNSIIYSVYSLVQAINNQLQNNSNLDASSQLNRVNITNPLAIGYGFSQYQLTVQLNRFTTSNLPNSKIVVIFPNDNTIWTTNSSVFRFSGTNNELNTVISETPSIQTNYVITSNPTIVFTCVNPNYIASQNNYTITVQNSPTSGYNLTNYLKAINTAFTTANTPTPSNLNGPIYLTNTNASVNTTTSFFTLNVDIANNFTNLDYNIDVSNSFLKQFGLFNGTTTDISLSTITTTFTGSVDYQPSFTVDVANLITVKPASPGNQYAPYNYVSVPVGTVLYINSATPSNDLAQVLNSIFSTYIDTDGNEILNKTSISFTTGSGNTLITTLTLQITKTLTQLDYTATFNDVAQDSWHKNLGLITSPATYILSSSIYNPNPNVSYSTITGTTTINSSDYITIGDGTGTTPINNTLTIQPKTTSTGVYTGDNSNTIVLTVPNGTYTRDQLYIELNALLSSATTPNGQTICKGCAFSATTNPNTNLTYTSFRANVNKIYTAADYLVDFYDPYSYTSCFNIAQSIQNTTWDSTLGWILGFHNFTEYPLATATPISSTTNTSLTGLYIDPATNIITFTGDTAVSTYIYNSFLIILDDYNQNHMNDGLVTTTKADTSIPLPSYASRAASKCDPVNTQSIVSFINTNPSATGDDTNIPQNLTKNQIYSAQEILNAQNGISTQTVSVTNALSNVKTNQRYYSNGPFAKDVFAIVPLKLAGQTQNTPYVDFSGTLQNQERVYFGPVNIHRMTVKLLNDRGEIVDLNNANWSFSLICEQLYQQKRT